MTTFRIEAESMSLTIYHQESKSFASGGQYISLSGGSTEQSGSASLLFSGPTGLYDVVIGYFDENDGVSHLEVLKQGKQLDAWDWEQNLGSGGANSQTQTRRTVATGLSIEPGETFELRGQENRGEPARIDYIEFIAKPPIVKRETIRIEAESMSLTTYHQESKSFASGGQYIGLSGGSTEQSGSASFTFSGPNGLYDVVIGYFDENDGVSHLKVLKQGKQLDAWDWEQNLGSGGANSQTQTRRTVATGLSIEPGETFQLRGQENRGEPARIDYIEFIPVASGSGGNFGTTINGTSAADRLTGNDQNNIINGEDGSDRLVGGAGNDTLDGGRGSDTADYTGIDNGIIADLTKGLVLAPLFGTATNPKLMPLGDSITAGQHRTDPTPGAYRIQLWDDFTADGFNVNFVGSQSNGPDSLGDKDHEGHPGWRMRQISDLVQGGLFTTQKSDIVMLMIGTNDVMTNFRSLSQMKSDLGTLIDQITKQIPNSQLLVSSIAPIDPLGKKFTSLSDGQAKAKKAQDFNKLIPHLVDEKADQGKNVAFVDVGGKLSVDDIVADGIHPDAEGYDKMGNAWYNKLVERDTLISIENLVGTAFDDHLTGDANDNMLEGGAGYDLLKGGGGSDTFVYRRKESNRDLLADFSDNDRFEFSASFGGGLTAGVKLSTTASSTGVFVSSQSPNPIGSNANFLYNTDTGWLDFDRDGTGPSKTVPIATLFGSPALNAQQFTITA